MISALSPTNESHIKLDLCSPDIKEKENEGENYIKTCKNNLSIKPDIYEHNSKKYLKINLWIMAIWDGENIRMKGGGQNEMYWHSEVSFHLKANILKGRKALSVINNSFFTSYFQLWSYTIIWKILLRITCTKLQRKKHYKIIWQTSNWITNVCTQQQIKRGRRRDD